MPLAQGCGIVSMVSQPKLARDGRVDSTSAACRVQPLGVTAMCAVTQGLLVTVSAAWAPVLAEPSSAGRPCGPPLAFHASFPVEAPQPYRRRAGASARTGLQKPSSPTLTRILTEARAWTPSITHIRASLPSLGFRV